MMWEKKLHNPGLCRYCDSIRQRGIGVPKPGMPVPPHKPEAPELPPGDPQGLDLEALKKARENPVFTYLGEPSEYKPIDEDGPDADTLDPLPLDPEAIRRHKALAIQAGRLRPEQGDPGRGGELLHAAIGRADDSAPIMLDPGLSDRGWVQRALIEYESARREIDELEAQRRKRRLRAFGAKLRELTGMTVSVGAESYSIDGVTFSIERSEWGDQVCVVLECWTCHKPRVYVPVEDVVGLGKALAGDFPDGCWCDSCRAASADSERSAGAQLVELITRITTGNRGTNGRED